MMTTDEWREKRQRTHVTDKYKLKIHESENNNERVQISLTATLPTLVNKTNEFQAIVMKNHMDMAAISETWFTLHMSEDVWGIPDSNVAVTNLRVPDVGRIWVDTM